jgi:hypothetical protein
LVTGKSWGSPRWLLLKLVEGLPPNFRPSRQQYFI